jgi:hypothetical protein
VEKMSEKKTCATSADSTQYKTGSNIGEQQWRAAEEHRGQEDICISAEQR